MGNSERCDCFFKKWFQCHDTSCVFCRGFSPSMCLQSNEGTESSRISGPIGGNKSPQGWHDSLTCFFPKLLSAPRESWSITWSIRLCGDESTVLLSSQRQLEESSIVPQVRRSIKLIQVAAPGESRIDWVQGCSALTSWGLIKDVCQSVLICQRVTASAAERSENRWVWKRCGLLLWGCLM